MKKTLLASSLTAALATCFASPASAQGATDLGAGFSLAGNATVVNDYRFRGYSQTNFRPAIQLGFDITHESGFYLGNWNSNVADNVFNEANLEMDLYGGWRGQLGNGVALDVGVLQYYYPGSDSTPIDGDGGNFYNTDVYVGLSYDVFSLKYSHTPTDFFNTPDSKGTWYLDATANIPLEDGWGVVAHLGYQKLKNQVDMDGGDIGHYIDYKLGVTKDLNGWVVGLAAVGASDDNWLPTRNGKESGRLGALLSVSRVF